MKHVLSLVVISFIIFLCNRGVLTAQVCSQERKAICILQGQDVSGTINFIQTTNNDPLKITGSVHGLKPGDHGFHIHEKGDLSKGCTSTGSHYNPHQKTHGAPHSNERHAGDLGNVKADSNGVAYLDLTDRIISLFGQNNIVGRAVVVHADSDDLGVGGFPDSKTTGHAGGRLACCIIGIA